MHETVAIPVNEVVRILMQLAFVRGCLEASESAQITALEQIAAAEAAINAALS